MILYYSVNVYLSAPLMLLVQWIVYTRLATWSKVSFDNIYTLSSVGNPNPQSLIDIILDYLYKFRGSYLVIFLNSYLRFVLHCLDSLCPRLTIP